ncbi:hypothetical protein BHE74_00059709 [Ensete ventricosum]|nr:hypothetical protein BHE74_00059709 [Ensete ventricosum]RZS19331.1 hypothetical protein BHM03_00051714 [Ensete ventricosum]
MAPNSWRYLIAFLGECRGTKIRDKNQTHLEKLGTSGLPVGPGRFNRRQLLESLGFTPSESPKKCHGSKRPAQKLRMPSGKNTSTAGAESSPPKVEEIRVETATKRPVESLAPDQAAAIRPGKRVKIAGHHYQMAFLDMFHDVGRLVTIMGNRASLLEAEIDKLKTEGDPEQLAVARQQVVALQADNAELKSKLEELTRRSDQADKELNEL